jgi:glucose-6-phosphate isomerase
MQQVGRLTESPAWQALKKHQAELAHVHMRDLFAKDADRFHKFSLFFNGILLDYSKNIITEESVALLINLAKQAHLEEWIAKTFAGEKINITENRAVLHTALRNRSPDAKIIVDGQVSIHALYFLCSLLVIIGCLA